MSSDQSKWKVKYIWLKNWQWRGEAIEGRCRPLKELNWDKVRKWGFAIEANQIRIFYREDRRKCSSHTCHSPVRIDHLKSEVGGDSRGAFLTLKLRPRSGNGIGWHTGVTGRREADQVAGLWFSSALTVVHLVNVSKQDFDLFSVYKMVQSI